MLVGVAVLAGLAARRRPWPAVAVVAVLGLLAGAAAWTAPSFAQLDLLPPLIATAAGVGAVRWLHPRLFPVSTGVPDPTYDPGARRPSPAAASCTAPPRSASSGPPRSPPARPASCSPAASATPAPT